jgi:hypothetical protein
VIRLTRIYNNIQGNTREKSHNSHNQYQEAKSISNTLTRGSTRHNRGPTRPEKGGCYRFGQEVAEGGTRHVLAPTSLTPTEAAQGYMDKGRGEL